MSDNMSMGKWVERGGGTPPGSDLHGNRAPALREVVLALRLFGERYRQATWVDVLRAQIDSISAVRGSYWYTQLLLSGDPPRLPRSTPDPITGLEFDAGAGTLGGTLLLWLDEGMIDCVELAAYDMESVDHYPAPSEIRAWGDW